MQAPPIRPDPEQIGCVYEGCADPPSWVLPLCIVAAIGFGIFAGVCLIAY